MLLSTGGVHVCLSTNGKRARFEDVNIYYKNICTHGNSVHLFCSIMNIPSCFFFFFFFFLLIISNMFNKYPAMKWPEEDFDKKTGRQVKF